MFPLASLIAVALSASVSATSSLSLSIASPKTVDGVQNLKLITTLKNTGDETLRLLNDPHTPLTKLETKAFTITGSSGLQPTFKGALAKYEPHKAAAAGAYTVLEAGKSVTLNHDLSTLYNFTSAGEDEYTFTPKSPFTLVKDDGSLETIEPEVESAKARVFGQLAVTRPHRKRAEFPGCSTDQKSQISNAYLAAQKYASNAVSYFQSHTSPTGRYSTWFGDYDKFRYSVVYDHFKKISVQDWASFTYDCTCNERGVYAYVFPNTFGDIHLCPSFWQATTTGTDSQAGTLVHESSHFTKNGGTDDYVYGQTQAQNLAKSNPDEAIENADNHEYFAENNPARN